MTSNGGGGYKGFQEVNVKDEYGRGGNGIVGDGPGLLGDDELRTNKVDENVKDGHGQVVHGHVPLQVSQQQPQGPLVHWERFLHVRSIKVMLVENDDSTRHIVTALLRNCKYEVIEAANGFQAWKILEDLSNHIDIVLTEVVMPCLSGIGLLCKIMSHKTRQNIPVIMMSSHDSMGLVFKCLSKGAVDFLVKPIRKNELKNLWQHVWRRCHSSSGSGSEIGTHAQKSVNSKSSVRSDNDSGSNIGDDNGSTGNGIDDGSGTQSSWTKQAVEVDSSRAAYPWDQTAECPDITCALVIRSAETPATRHLNDQEEQLDNVTKGKELAIGRPKNFEIPESPVEVPFKLNGTKLNTIQELDPAQNRRKDKGLANCSGEYSSNKHKAADINMPPQMENGECESLRESEKILDTNPKDIDDSNEVAVTELSLKRPRAKDAGGTVQNDRNVLRHSELSEFTRYNTTSNTFKAPHGITGSSSQLDNGSEFVKKESMHDVRAHSDGYLVYQSLNEVGNNMDVDSSTNKLSTNPVIQKEKSEARFTVNCLHPSSSFKPKKTDLRCSSQQVLLTKADDITSTDVPDLPRDLHQELPVQHIHHHHHVHHYHNMDRQQPLSNHDDLSFKELAIDAPHCESSNVLGGPVEGNPENYSLNRSASGSKHGSNGQNRSSTVVNVGGTNVESDVGLAGKSGSGDASGSGSGNRIDQHKSAQREAALTKFRQKRKERCFQKKVRYQNRKRLAEQRPRVRGQFVRQTGHYSSNNDADS